jgi:glycosyltransferase involved in cell wall biosynthesis
MLALAKYATNSRAGGRPVVRVLVVTTWFPTKAIPHSGIFNLRDVNLLARDHEVTVVHLVNAPITPDIDDVAVLENRPFALHRIAFSASNVRGFIPTARTLKPFLAQADVLHTMAFSSLLPFVGRRIRLPWVHTEHWSGISAKLSGLRALRRWLVFSRVLSQPDVVVLVSGFLRDQIRRLRKRNVKVIGNFVDIPESISADPTHDGVHLVAVGNMVPGKGALIAVETIKLLNDAGVDARLTWVGDGPERLLAQARAVELQVEDRVVLAGAMPAEAIGTFLDAADIFILPTESETFGVAIAEAMAHGLPVVVGSVGGFRDFINPRASRVASPHTPEAFSNAVQSLLADDQLLSRSEIAADARAKFDENHRRAQYAEVYALAQHAHAR